MKTAVEWLVEQLDGERHLTENEIKRLIQQAKEMEKDQMKLSRVPIAYENKSWQGLMERHFERLTLYEGRD
jgi:hypothetical protein